MSEAKISDTERASAHYADQLKAALFAEVVQALRAVVDARTSDETLDARLAARRVIAKIDSNELLRS